jgi:hypothetical protein
MSTELATRPNVVPLKAGGRVSAIIPQSVEEVFRIANAICASGLAPSGMKTAEQITVAIMHGAEIGLPPMQAIQRIAVVNGRPTIWGDAIPALLLSRGFKLNEFIDGTGEKRKAVCELTRPDGADLTRWFSVDDAKQAGLWGKIGPWKQYPDRMLQMRARGYAARDGAADVLAGLYISEEVQDIDPRPVRKSSAEGKRDGTVIRFDEIRRQIAQATNAETVEAIKAQTADEVATMPARWADMINDDIAARLQDFATPMDQAAVLREIERDLDALSAAEVKKKHAAVIMAMDEDGRASALEMIQAAKG